MAAAGLNTETLRELPGSNVRPEVMARKIRATTTVNVQWIAANPAMRNAANASQPIRRPTCQRP